MKNDRMTRLGAKRNACVIFGNVEGRIFLGILMCQREELNGS